MTSPLPLPDWVPWWVHLAVFLALLFVAVMFALMPFSVFGTKSRLEAIEIRLDEIQAEIRSLALRLPELSVPDDDPQLGIGPVMDAGCRRSPLRPSRPRGESLAGHHGRNRDYESKNESSPLCMRP